MCSLDNWSFQLFHLQTQVNQYTWVFAFSCVFCGAYVVNVLIMANLTINYYKEQMKVSCLLNEGARRRGEHLEMEFWNLSGTRFD
jgi:hypothetical protein